MSKYDKTYNKLREKYTDEEIADAMLIPADLTEQEQKEVDSEIRAFRMKLLSEMTEEQRTYSDLLRFRYQLENYIKNMDYDEAMNFGTQVEEYARILKRNKKNLAEELNVHYTKLSRVINHRESPNLEFMYRLEEHSGTLVPAIVWWKVLMKKQEYEINQDQQTRKAVATTVKRAVAHRA